MQTYRVQVKDIIPFEKKVQASNPHTAIKKVLAPNASNECLTMTTGQRITIIVDRVS